MALVFSDLIRDIQDPKRHRSVSNTCSFDQEDKRHSIKEELMADPEKCNYVPWIKLLTDIVCRKESKCIERGSKTFPYGDFPTV